MSNINSNITNKFNSSIQKYEKTSLNDMLTGSGISPQKFKYMLLNELESSIALQQAFQKNPKSFFATALFCAELNLSPSSIVGEFFFNVSNLVVKPLLGYKGLVTLLLRSEKVKKIWSEVVYNDDDFEYELGLEPKMVHIPKFNSIKTSENIKCIYACAKLDDDVIFKVMTIEEIKTIIETIENPSDYYFNDKKDPEKWMLKKIVLKQLSKLMPKEDYTLKKAISYDDKIEGGSYLMLDENDSVKIIQGNFINKKRSIYENLKDEN